MFGRMYANNLIDYWPKIKEFPFKSHGIRIDTTKYPVCSKSNDIYDFFTFIKLIATHRVTFHNAITSIMVFSSVSNVELTLSI